MRRIGWLLVALALTLVALRLPTGVEPYAPYVLRDGLALALLGAGLFAWQAPRPERLNVPTLGWSTLFLLAVTALAAALRGWRLADLPSACLATECERALQLTQAPLGFSLLDRLARGLLGVASEPLFSLRLAGAIIGSLTIPALYGAARRLTGPVGALLATLLLTLNPWHLWLSRTADPWIIAPLLILGLVWALYGISAEKHGLLRYGALALVLLGLLVLALLDVSWRWRGVDWLALVNALVYSPGVDATPLFVGYPLLDPALAAAGLAGFVYALRYGARQGLFGLVIGALLCTALAVGATTGGTPVERASLLLLPWLGLTAALALDAALGRAVQLWRPLFAPALLVAGLGVLALVVIGRPTLTRLTALDVGRVAGNNALAGAMAEYLAATTADDTLYFAPAAVLNSPTMRLLAGSRVQDGQFQPLEQALDYWLAGKEPTTLHFLIPGDEARWLEVLRQIFPASTLESQVGEGDAQLLFIILTVTAQQQQAQQGLAGVLIGSDGLPAMLPAVGPLTIEWPALTSLSGPLRVEWQGSLLAPAAGDYRFAADGVAPTAANLILQLDGATVLDSQLGFSEQQIALVQGVYQLTIIYDALLSTQPAPLTIRWQRPGADWEIVPRTALIHPPLPTIGLVGAYYAGSQWQGTPLAQRKDLLIGPADFPTPYSVQWQGQMAAPRAGEYLFATLADGANQVDIDGRRLIDSQPSAEGPLYREGLIYLTRGWHAIDIRYATATEAPEFRLLWQPAGGGGTQLSTANLTPLLAGAPPLPSPADLLDPQLGDAAFALTQALDSWQPQVRIPPTNLPPLPMTLAWQTTGGCGAGEGQLNQPHGVALHTAANRILVADTGNRRVALYTLEGVAAGVIQNAAFQEPADVQVTATDLWLLDAVAQQIFRLDLTTGAAETAPVSTSFYRPRGFASDPLGNWLVADTGGGRIALVQSDGASVGQFGGPDTLLGKGQPVDALWSNGQIWAISAEDGRLWQVNSGGSLTLVQPTNTLDGPKLASLPTGAFFASDPGRSQVLYLAPTGQPLAQLTAPGLWIAPTGIDSILTGEQVQLAVIDSATCTLSLWQGPVSGLPVALAAP